jgi:hypothetical protein
MTAGLYVARNLLTPMLSSLADPDKEKHEQARRQAKAHLERLNRRRNINNSEGGDSGDAKEAQRVEDLVLNEYENLVALEMVAPEDIHVGFDGKLRA